MSVLGIFWESAGAGVKPMNVPFAVLLCTTATLVACGSSSEPDPDLLNDPIFENTFFNGQFRDIRDAGEVALEGVNLKSYLQSAIAQTPADVFSGVEGNQVLLDCEDEGTLTVTVTVEDEYPTFITTAQQEFDACVQGGSTFMGTLTTSVEQFADATTNRTTTGYEFDISINPLVNGSGSVVLKGSFLEEILSDFDSPEGCAPAVSSRHVYKLEDGSVITDTANSVSAIYQSLDYAMSVTDRYFDIDTNCRTESFASFEGLSVGVFDRIADSEVMIVKSGVFSSAGIADTDASGRLEITAPLSSNRLLITSTGDTPESVQVDLVDNNAVQSFISTWTFGS